MSVEEINIEQRIQNIRTSVLDNFHKLLILHQLETISSQSGFADEFKQVKESLLGAIFGKLDESKQQSINQIKGLSNFDNRKKALLLNIVSNLYQDSEENASSIKELVNFLITETLHSTETPVHKYAIILAITKMHGQVIDEHTQAEIEKLKASALSKMANNLELAATAGLINKAQWYGNLLYIAENSDNFPDAKNVQLKAQEAIKKTIDEEILNNAGLTVDSKMGQLMKLEAILLSSGVQDVETGEFIRNSKNQLLALKKDDKNKKALDKYKDLKDLAFLDISNPIIDEISAAAIGELQDIIQNFEMSDKKFISKYKDLRASVDQLGEHNFNVEKLEQIKIQVIKQIHNNIESITNERSSDFEKIIKLNTLKNSIMNDHKDIAVKISEKINLIKEDVLTHQLAQSGVSPTERLRNLYQTTNAIERAKVGNDKLPNDLKNAFLSRIEQLIKTTKQEIAQKLEDGLVSINESNEIPPLQQAIQAMRLFVVSGLSLNELSEPSKEIIPKLLKKIPDMKSDDVQNIITTELEKINRMLTESTNVTSLVNASMEMNGLLSIIRQGNIKLSSERKQAVETIENKLIETMAQHIIIASRNVFNEINSEEFIARGKNALAPVENYSVSLTNQLTELLLHSQNQYMAIYYIQQLIDIAEKCLQENDHLGFDAIISALNKKQITPLLESPLLRKEIQQKMVKLQKFIEEDPVTHKTPLIIRFEENQKLSVPVPRYYSAQLERITTGINKEKVAEAIVPIKAKFKAAQESLAERKGAQSVFEVFSKEVLQENEKRNDELSASLHSSHVLQPKKVFGTTVIKKVRGIITKPTNTKPIKSVTDRLSPNTSAEKALAEKVLTEVSKNPLASSLPTTSFTKAPKLPRVFVFDFTTIDELFNAPGDESKKQQLIKSFREFYESRETGDAVIFLASALPSETGDQTKARVSKRISEILDIEYKPAPNLIRVMASDSSKNKVDYINEAITDLNKEIETERVVLFDQNAAEITAAKSVGFDTMQIAPKDLSLNFMSKRKEILFNTNLPVWQNELAHINWSFIGDLRDFAMSKDRTAFVEKFSAQYPETIRQFDLNLTIIAHIADQIESYIKTVNTDPNKNFLVAEKITEIFSNNENVKALAQFNCARFALVKVISEDNDNDMLVKIFDAATIKSVQWLTKYQGHLEAIPKTHALYNKANDLKVKYSDIVTNFNNRVRLGQIAKLEGGRGRARALTEALNRREHVPTAEINQALDNVSVLLTHYVDSKLNPADESKVLQDLKSTVDHISTKLQGKSKALSLNTTEYSDIDHMIDNMTSLIYFAMMIDKSGKAFPIEKVEENIKDLRNIIDILSIKVPQITNAKEDLDERIRVLSDMNKKRILSTPVLAEVLPQTIKPAVLPIDIQALNEAEKAAHNIDIKSKPVRYDAPVAVPEPTQPTITENASSTKKSSLFSALLSPLTDLLRGKKTALAKTSPAVKPAALDPTVLSNLKLAVSTPLQLTQLIGNGVEEINKEIRQFDNISSVPLETIPMRLQGLLHKLIGKMDPNNYGAVLDNLTELIILAKKIAPKEFYESKEAAQLNKFLLETTFTKESHKFKAGKLLEDIKPPLNPDIVVEEIKQFKLDDKIKKLDELLDLLSNHPEMKNIFENHNFADIIRKSHAVGYDQHGGQQGIHRYADEEKAVAAYRKDHKNDNSDVAQLVIALIDARAALSKVYSGSSILDAHKTGSEAQKQPQSVGLKLAVNGMEEFKGAEKIFNEKRPGFLAHTQAPVSKLPPVSQIPSPVVARSRLRDVAANLPPPPSLQVATILRELKKDINEKNEINLPITFDHISDYMNEHQRTDLLRGANQQQLVDLVKIHPVVADWLYNHVTAIDPDSYENKLGKDTLEIIHALMPEGKKVKAAITLEDSMGLRAKAITHTAEDIIPKKSIHDTYELLKASKLLKDSVIISAHDFNTTYHSLMKSLSDDDQMSIDLSRCELAMLKHNINTQSKFALQFPEKEYQNQLINIRSSLANFNNSVLVVLHGVLENVGITGHYRQLNKMQAHLDNHKKKLEDFRKAMGGDLSKDKLALLGLSKEALESRETQLAKIKAEIAKVDSEMNKINNLMDGFKQGIQAKLKTVREFLKEIEKPVQISEWQPATPVKLDVVSKHALPIKIPEEVIVMVKVSGEYQAVPAVQNSPDLSNNIYFTVSEEGKLNSNVPKSQAKDEEALRALARAMVDKAIKTYGATKKDDLQLAGKGILLDFAKEYAEQKEIYLLAPAEAQKNNLSAKMSPQLGGHRGSSRG
jgi:hypothetical protein